MNRTDFTNSNRNLKRSLALRCLFLACLPSIVYATDDDRRVTRWVPSFGLSLGLDISNASASSVTGNTQPPLLEPSDPIRPPTSGDVLITGPTVGFDFALTTPQVPLRFFSPRVFVHASFDANLTAETKPSAESARGPVSPPLGPSGDPIPRFPVFAILGQGTITTVDPELLQIRSGIGLVFSFDVGDRRLHLKPSFEYIRKRQKLSGGVTRAIRTGGERRNFVFLLDSLDDARLIVIDVATTKVLHGIGPGLELELEIARKGSFDVSVFAGAKAYRIVSDRDVELTGTGANLSPIPESATIRFNFDPWTYRVDAGFRVAWHPK